MLQTPPTFGELSLTRLALDVFLAASTCGRACYRPAETSSSLGPLSIPSMSSANPEIGYLLRTMQWPRWQRPHWRACSQGWPSQGSWPREDRADQNEGETRTGRKDVDGLLPKPLLPDSLPDSPGFGGHFLSHVHVDVNIAPAL